METNKKTSDRKEEARFIERCKKAADKAQLGLAKANKEAIERKLLSIKIELKELDTFVRTNCNPTDLGETGKIWAGKMNEADASLTDILWSIK